MSDNNELPNGSANPSNEEPTTPAETPNTPQVSISVTAGSSPESAAQSLASAAESGADTALVIAGGALATATDAKETAEETAAAVTQEIKENEEWTTERFNMMADHLTRVENQLSELLATKSNEEPGSPLSDSETTPPVVVLEPVETTPPPSSADAADPENPGEPATLPEVAENHSPRKVRNWL